MFDRRLSGLMDHVNNLERSIPKFSALSHLTIVEIRPNKESLVATGIVLYVLALRASSRLDRSCDAFVFNIADLISMNGLKDQLLASSSMAHKPRLMTKLQKRNRHHSCSLILQLQKKILAKLFSSKQSATTATIHSKNKNNYRQIIYPGGDCCIHFT